MNLNRSVPVNENAVLVRLKSCNYRYYMKPIEIKVARIGNSRGVRLPAGTLDRYDIGDTVIMEERLEGILLRPHGPPIQKLSLQETARQMASEQEDWSEWDVTNSDGLDKLPWDNRAPRKVAEPKREYPDTKKSKKK
jgi:antitoxin component of MazEF toxin-antitoxin module